MYERACVSVQAWSMRTRAEHEKEKEMSISSFPHPHPLVLEVNKSPAILFPYARIHSRISKEKIEGLGTGYSLNLYTAYWCYGIGSRRFESCWEFMTVFFLVQHSLHADCRTFHIIIHSKYFAVSDWLHSPGSIAITNQWWPIWRCKQYTIDLMVYLKRS